MPATTVVCTVESVVETLPSAWCVNFLQSFSSGDFGFCMHSSTIVSFFRPPYFSITVRPRDSFPPDCRSRTASITTPLRWWCEIWFEWGLDPAFFSSSPAVDSRSSLGVLTLAHMVAHSSTARESRMRFGAIVDSCGE